MLLCSLIFIRKKCVLCFFFNYHRKKITILNVNENCLNELLRNQITPHIAWGIILLPFFSFYSGSSSSDFVPCSFFSSLPCIREVINFCNFLDFKESFIVFLSILQQKFPAIASSSVFSFSRPFLCFSCGIYKIWFWLRSIFFPNISHHLVEVVSFLWPSNFVVIVVGKVGWWDIISSFLWGLHLSSPHPAGRALCSWLVALWAGSQVSYYILPVLGISPCFSLMHRNTGAEVTFLLRVTSRRPSLGWELAQMSVFPSGLLPCDEGSGISLLCAHPPLSPLQMRDAGLACGLCAAWELQGQGLTLFPPWTWTSFYFSSLLLIFLDCGSGLRPFSSFTRTRFSSLCLCSGWLVSESWALLLHL